MGIMAQNLKFIREKLPIICGLILLRIISWAPQKWLNLVGGGLGWVLYYLLPARRHVGLVNLSLCFPQMSQQQKIQLLKQHFCELVRASLAYGLMFYASAAKLRHRIKIRGLENYNQVRNTRPIILLAPHFLALDLGANRLSLETPGYSIYAQQRNRYLTQRIKQARLRFIKDQGGEIFSRQEGLRTIIRKLKQTFIPFYYLPDQDMDQRDSIYVPFFAHPLCATLATLPKLVKLSNALVIPVATYREGEHYIVEVGKPWTDYPSNDLYADVTLMNRQIEAMIMQHPSQYLWLHKRFKTQPNLKRGQLYG
jgi:KDO2-lipid IV(A) lauroyltransferase